MQYLPTFCNNALIIFWVLSLDVADLNREAVYLRLEEVKTILQPLPLILQTLIRAQEEPLNHPS